MALQTFFFVAPIANTGGSFRSIKLSPPFKIERWNYDKLTSFINDMEGATDWTPDPRVDELRCVPHHGNTGHVVTATISLEHDEAVEDILKLHRHFEEQDKVLAEQIRLIGVYFSSPVLLSAEYWFAVNENGQREMQSALMRSVEEGQSATPSYQEALRLSNFLARYSFRPRAEYVSIALDHWGHSFDAIPKHMQLLSLVTALEVLLNPAHTELKHRVARAAAVLIGSDKEESKEIYSGLSKIYDARSQVVHTGVLKSVDKVKFWQLRWWVSRSILKVMALGLPKERLCSMLNELGFGEGQAFFVTHASTLP